MGSGMSANRRVIAAAALAVLVLIAASAAIAVGGGGNTDRASAPSGASAGSGPFLTAGTMPQLAAPGYDFAAARRRPKPGRRRVSMSDARNQRDRGSCVPGSELLVPRRPRGPGGNSVTGRSLRRRPGL